MNQLVSSGNSNSPLVTCILIALIVWTLVWKGLAMWKAARGGHKWWFVIILVVNTLGILDIIYYFFVGKKSMAATAAKTV